MRPSKPIMLATVDLFVWTRLVGLFAPAVAAGDTPARFKGGIGATPARPVGDDFVANGVRSTDAMTRPRVQSKPARPEVSSPFV